MSGHITGPGQRGRMYSALRPVAFRQDTYEPTKATSGHLTDLGSAGACSTLRPVTLLQQPYCPAALQSQLTDQIHVWSPLGNAGACSTLRPVAFRQDTYDPAAFWPGPERPEA